MMKEILKKRKLHVVKVQIILVVYRKKLVIWTFLHDKLFQLQRQ